MKHRKTSKQLSEDTTDLEVAVQGVFNSRASVDTTWK